MQGPGREAVQGLCAGFPALRLQTLSGEKMLRGLRLTQQRPAKQIFSLNLRASMVLGARTRRTGPVTPGFQGDTETLRWIGLTVCPGIIETMQSTSRTFWGRLWCKIDTRPWRSRRLQLHVTSTWTSTDKRSQLNPVGSDTLPCNGIFFIVTVVHFYVFSCALVTVGIWKLRPLSFVMCVRVQDKTPNEGKHSLFA